MNSVTKLRWSDVWLLVALYFCSLRNQSRLSDAIAAADAMNHAVINFEELSSALVRLEQHGLITVEPGSWITKCTDLAIDLVSPIAAQNSLALRVWQETEKKLGVSPWIPREPLPHPENSLRYPSFTNEDYEKEVAEYLKDMRVKK